MCISYHFNLNVSLILLGLIGTAPGVASAQTSDTTYATPGPELIGGIDSLNGRVQFPREALEDCVEGRLIVEMTVRPDGSVEDVEVLKTPEGDDYLAYEQAVRYRLDKEALRVVRQARFRWPEDWPDDRKRQIRLSLPVLFQPPVNKCDRP